MLKIIYLEDDINLSNTITEFLVENGFEVISTYTAKDTFEELYNNNFDLLILDIKLPDTNGFEFLQKLLDANINLPTIFTTTLNDIESLDKGYSLGADDYLRKPFELKELLHRINIIFKRHFHTLSNKIKLPNDIVFDISSNTLIKNHNTIYISKKALELLKLFVKNKNSIITLETIYNYLWSTSEDISDGSLRTYILSLRRIFGKDTILNIKKQGYKFVV